MRRILASLATAGVAAAAAGAPPTAEELLAAAGFPADARKAVLGGEIVHVDLPSTSDLDLAVGLAFVIRETPAAFDRELFRKQLLTTVDRHTLSHGLFEGEGSVAQLAGLSLGGGEEELYRAEAPGEALNLSAEEIEALRAVRSPGSALAAEVREQLLARYRDYRARGLAGIAPYQKGGGRIDPAAALRRATDAAGFLRRTDAALQAFARDLPAGPPPAQLEEIHSWSHFEAQGKATIALGHSFGTGSDGSFSVVQREYYVNRGYDSEQAVVSMLPVAEGSLVVYTNHTSTDQVEGFGGDARRAVGRRLMASQLEALFETVRRAAPTAETK